MKVQLNDLIVSPVTFSAGDHSYHLGEKELGGVTPIISWLYPRTYEGIPEEVLMRAAEYGTMIHSKCQLADAIGAADLPIVERYKEMMKDKGLVPIVHEYIVSDEENVASSIDIVCADGSLCDIKTTSKVHRENVALQLSIYAMLYEEQTGKDAGELYCIWLPKEQYGEPEIIRMPRISEDVCRFIISEYVAGNEPDEAREKVESLDLFGENTMKEDSDEMMREYMKLDAECKRMAKRMDEIKGALLDSLQRYDMKTLSGEGYVVSRKAASIRRSVDSKKLSTEYPDVYEKVMKETKIGESIQIKLS